jgi:hypothetical protein
MNVAMTALVGVMLAAVMTVTVSGCTDSGTNEDGARNPDGLGDGAPVVGDHWHAYLGVDVCGAWLPNGDTFELRADDPGVRAGLHFHGDGIMHFHPFASDEAGNLATVGRLLDYGGWSLSDRSMALWDGVRHDGTTPCEIDGAAKPAELRWKVGRVGEPWPTETRTGDPARYAPANGDIVALYFVPSGTSLTEPPAAQQAMSAIGDLGGASALPPSSGNG